MLTGKRDESETASKCEVLKYLNSIMNRGSHSPLG